MESTLKQRLIGAAVLAALAIIFLPMLLKGPDVKEPDAAEVPLSMPDAPAGDYQTRELPLTAPENVAPEGGVLGMAPAREVGPDELPAAGPNSAPALATPGNPTASASDVAGATPAPAPNVELPIATPAEKSSTSAAVGAGNYVVNIGSFSNLANANRLASKLRAANLPVAADPVTLAGGTAMRLRVGPYVDRAAAEAARLRADAITGSGSKVIALDAESSAVKAPKPSSPAAVKPVVQAPAAMPAKPVAAAAKPTAPPTGELAKPVAVSSGFAVQLSAPSVESEALALRDRARASGFSSFVQRIDTEAGVRYRVRVGPVADRSAAETMRDAVNGKLGTKGIVVANP